MLTSKPVPDTWIQTPDLKQKGIQLCIRREDLTHPVYGGNKLRKLKYHFEAFKNSQYTEVLSFGGAWSNHVFAISGACMELDIPCRLIIRGEEPQAPSSTLIYAKNSGAQLHFVSREEYRKRYEAEYTHEVLEAVKTQIPATPSSLSKFPIPGLLEDLAMQCLRKAPDERPDITEFIRTLQEDWFQDMDWNRKR